MNKNHVACQLSREASLFLTLTVTPTGASIPKLNRNFLFFCERGRTRQFGQPYLAELPRPSFPSYVDFPLPITAIDSPVGTTVEKVRSRFQYVYLRAVKWRHCAFTCAVHLVQKGSSKASPKGVVLYVVTRAACLALTATARDLLDQDG